MLTIRLHKIEKGGTLDLADLKGQVVLVVNTASKCGFTPQFDGLEKLYKKVSIVYIPSLPKKNPLN